MTAAGARLRQAIRSAIVSLLRLATAPLAPLLVLLGVRILTNCRSGIGHLTIETTWFRARRALSADRRLGKFHILLIEHRSIYANAFLIRLLKLHFFISQSRLLDLLFRTLAEHPRLGIDIGVAPPIGVPEDRNFSIEAAGRHARMASDIQRYRNTIGKRFFHIPRDLRPRGAEGLEGLGIGRNDWFVCLHAGEISAKGKHAYEPHRRQRIGDYEELIEHIVREGGKVVRMGDKDLPAADDRLGVIDYPKSRFKSDWMDLFLISECRYFIGCQSGLTWVPVLFGTPVLITNLISWHFPPAFDGDISLPKLFRSRRTGKLVSVPEYVRNEFHLIKFDLSDQYETVTNRGRDLIAAAEEMERRLRDGAPESDALQERWKSSFACKEITFPTDTRICPSFLRTYRKTLLPDRD